MKQVKKHKLKKSIFDKPKPILGDKKEKRKSNLDNKNMRDESKDREVAHNDMSHGDEMDNIDEDMELALMEECKI